MAYIGSTPTSQNFISGTDYFNGTGSQTAFTLTRSVNSVNDVEVVVNNVIQQPNSYTVSGTTLTLSAAPSSGTSNVYVRYLATTQQSFTVGNNTVGYNQLTADMQSKFAMKNRIINGDFKIDQRTAGASVTPTTTGFFNYQSVDRWANIIGQASKFSMQQNAGSVTPPVGFTNYLGVTSLSAYTVLTGDYFQLAQNIEGYNVSDLGWGTANAKPVTLSFWVYSSLTGSFGGAIVNNGGSRTYPFSYTVSTANTWTQISVTIVGDTTGTWLTNNSVGLSLRFSLGMGSTYTGTAGVWSGNGYYAPTGSVNVVSTNGATWYLTGVQLEVGSSATGFEYRQYQQELALCQRYYQKMDGASGYLTGSTNVFRNLWWSFKSEMRTAPTCSVGWSAGTGGSYQRAGTSGVDLYVNAGDTTSSPYVTSATASAEL